MGGAGFGGGGKVELMYRKIHMPDEWFDLGGRDGGHDDGFALVVRMLGERFDRGFEVIEMVDLIENEVGPIDTWVNVAFTSVFAPFDKIAMVDVEPPYFNGKLPRADIVIDHHPNYTSGNAPFEDVRTKYGSTSTIMTEYLICAEEKISERLATALMYGIRAVFNVLSIPVRQSYLMGVIAPSERSTAGFVPSEIRTRT